MKFTCAMEQKRKEEEISILFQRNTNSRKKELSAQWKAFNERFVRLVQSQPVESCPVMGSMPGGNFWSWLAEPFRLTEVLALRTLSSVVDGVNSTVELMVAVILLAAAAAAAVAPPGISCFFTCDTHKKRTVAQHTVDSH